MEVDIIIDGFPECLKDRHTGNIEKTYYKICDYRISKKKNGWKFDWRLQQDKGNSPIYELYTEKDNILQGRISFYPREDHIFVDLVETAPHNFGSKGIYEGVGAHLFAIACKHSFLSGYDGYVSFLAKTRLIDHYKNQLGAVMLSSQVMGIFEPKAKMLVNKFFADEVKNGRIY
ncbi:MAG: hypothetical protein IJI14_17725 [Anaerolineaceae bacterium]|nr:hypothetical protein [Anaerolineaceae bacterium]